MTSAPPATMATRAAQVAAACCEHYLSVNSAAADVVHADVVVVVLLQPVTAPLKARATAAVTSRADSVCVCPVWWDSGVTPVHTAPTASPAAEVNATTSFPSVFAEIRDQRRLIVN